MTKKEKQKEARLGLLEDLTQKVPYVMANLNEDYAPGKAYFNKLTDAEKVIQLTALIYDLNRYKDMILTPIQMAVV